jgi:dTDP-4-amino-4,6-dideoxygalactose transaminase
MTIGGKRGVISTNDEKLWLKCWSIKDHGKNYKNVFIKNIKRYLNGYTKIWDQIIE